MKTLKERIEIEQAFLDGADMEFKERNNPHSPWLESDKSKDNYVFNWYICDYRIKPEPRVIYVNETNSVLHDVCWDTESQAARSMSTQNKVVKFIEVLD